MQCTELNLPFQVSYTLEQPPLVDSEFVESKGKSFGLLVLHGFSDHAVAARKRLLGSEPFQDLTILSPNAVFPAPVKKGNEYREAYSWYFRDPVTGAQMSSPQFAAEALIAMIEKLGLQDKTWIVIGFSQGGFFAPALVQAGLKVKAIIAVGSAYREESYVGLQPVRVHALHGTDDWVVNHDLSRASFDLIQKMGFGHEFHSLVGLGHTLNDEGRALVRKIIQSEMS